MADAPHNESNGEHPLTGDLVAALRQGSGGLLFEARDLERFRSAGTSLRPEALVTWLRDLNILAVTLRNDMNAGLAASQVERNLIDPLVHVLDNHVVQRGAATSRAETAQLAMSSERKKLEQDNRTVSALPKTSALVGATIRPKSKRGDA